VRWLWLWIGLGLAGVASAFGGMWAAHLYFAELSPRAMPGFDVSLPGGGYTKDDGSEYGRGKLVIFQVGGVEASVRVEWEPGGLSDDADVASARKTLAVIHRGKQRPIDVSTPVAIAGPERTRSFATRAGPATSWTTEIACGARRVALVTLSNHWGVESLHRRVAATFRCHPDAAKEQVISAGADSAAEE